MDMKDAERRGDRLEPAITQAELERLVNEVAAMPLIEWAVEERRTLACLRARGVSAPVFRKLVKERQGSEEVVMANLHKLTAALKAERLGKA